MVTVLLRGGLGNQMFEYAAGLNLSLKHKTQLVLDTTYLNDRFPRRNFSYRNYDLDVFNIEPKFTRLSQVSAAFPIPGLWLGLDLASCVAKKIVGGASNPMLWGFYQGEKYFAEHREAVRAAFQFRHPLIGEALKLAEEIHRTNSVSLHVRRGDYTLPKYEKLYGATDMAYYDRAIAFVADRATNAHFFIFSDDIAWCREHIKPPFPTMYIDDASRGPKAAFHLELMSRCKHNIIANSSFSWWAAWLNANPEKIVIAPEKWYSGEKASADIFSEEWVIL